MCHGNLRIVHQYFLVFRHVLEFHKLPNDGCQAPHKDQRMVACHQAKVPGRKLVYDTNFAPLGWRESRVTMKFPHVNDLLFPEEQKVQKTMSVSACYQAFCLTDSKRMFIRITTRVFPRIIGPAASGWYKGACHMTSGSVWQNLWGGRQKQGSCSYVSSNEELRPT